MTKLHLGCGNVKLDGWVGVDIKNGMDVRSMPFEKGSIEAIYASHILEHLSHRERPGVLAHWVDLLKPGGEIFVCVPDIQKLAGRWNDANYRTIEQYMLGGHVDTHDVHMSAYSEHSLRMALHSAGCHNTETFEPFVDDCSRWDFSLNMRAVKRDWTLPENPSIFAVFSEPTLGFSEHHRCWRDLLRSCKPSINEIPTYGAFWEQALECGIVGAMEAGADLILLTDYDTTFMPEDFDKLYETMMSDPQCAAVTGVQMSRHNDKPLVLEDHLDHTKPLTRVTFAHMGFTLIRASVFRELPRPWFFGVPGTNGWGTAMQSDADISFWRMLAEYGMKVYWRNDVVLGHMVPCIKYPCAKGTMFVTLRDFVRRGKPPQVEFVPGVFQQVAKAKETEQASQTEPGFDARSDLVAHDPTKNLAEVRQMVTHEVVAPKPPGVKELVNELRNANHVAPGPELDLAGRFGPQG